jgi:hypothetical protein
VSALWLQRFVPSEFGANIDVYAPNDKSVLDFVFALKRAIRKELRETGVPYTLICNGGFGGFVWAPLAQLSSSAATLSHPERRSPSQVMVKAWVSVAAPLYLDPLEFINYAAGGS